MNDPTKILIVEDERIVAEDLREELIELGHEVCGIATSSSQAIDLATKERPDLICMDIIIQGESDGIDTAIWIRDHLGIGSIFLSANSDGAIVERSKEAEPLGYIVKPYDANSLRCAIEVAVSKLEGDRKIEQNRHHLEAEVSRRTMELVDSNQKLQSQAKVDTALAQISTRFLEVTEKSIDELIQESLELIGTTLSARIGAVYLANNSKGVYETKHRWIRQNDPGNADALRPLGIHAAKEMMDEMIEENHYHLLDADLLAPYPSASQEALMAPIMLHRSHAGFLIFAGGMSGNTWDEAEFKLVSMAGQVFSSALDRKAMELENRELQAQLIQSQKMEAMGTLTGGIAHDFNNMLVPIIGYSGLLEQELEDHPMWQGHAEEVHRAAESAATLTRQLLAFSRRQILEKEICDLNTVIEESRNMVDRLLGESVTLEMNLSEQPLYSMVDRGQIQQVLMNLCINSRDAMTNGGTIKVNTEVLLPDSPHLKYVDASSAAAGWACLRVQDTGHGMPEETAARIFEPFYSTKGSNGTGLGLSVVHGIVSQHDGSIRLESVVGHGTVFYLYFPLQDSKPVSVSAPTNIASLDTSGHGERILVIEDEPQVQRFVTQALSSRGYSVEKADDIGPAREMLDGARGFRPFDLILCDCVLPGGNGVDFLVQELQVHPDTRAILTTGYTDRESLMQAAEDFDLGFLQKPYSLEKLFETVRRALDGRLAEAV